jgi:pSer/pThr/pTyr-binding forkhead associated (FHA) protein
MMKKFRSQESDLTPSPFDTAGPATQKLYDEGKTVQLKRSQDDTMRLLPGKFIIVKGDEVNREIRLYVPKTAQKEINFTVGSLPIPDLNPFSHIRIDAKTVSRRQAELHFDGSTYALTNLSTVNNTIVNGRTLGENEKITISDNDLIIMGEVEFRFAT